jgi:hypothetical protein
MGLIFDDRGNRMTPTYAVKKGARYRYYVSSALRGGPVGAASEDISAIHRWRTSAAGMYPCGKTVEWSTSSKTLPQSHG